MKKCNNCGAEQSDESLFCDQCGTRLGEVVSNGIPGPMPQQDDTDETATKATKGILPPTDRFAPTSDAREALAEKPEKPTEPVEKSETTAVPVVLAEESTELAEESTEPAEKPAEKLEEPTEQIDVVMAVEQPAVADEQPATVDEQPSAAEEPAQAEEQNSDSADEDISVEQLLSEKQTEQKNKKNNKAFKIGAIVACVVLVLAIIFCVVLANSNKGASNKQGNTTNSAQQANTSTSASNTSSGSSSSETNNGLSSEKAVASVGDFEFTIPENYEFDTQDGNLVVYGDDAFWALRINYDDIDFSKVSSNIEALKQRIEDSGYRITRYGVEAYKGAEYYWFDVDILDTNEKGVLALTQAPDQGAFRITLVDIDGTQSHDYLEEAAEIINTVSKVK